MFPAVLHQKPQFFRKVWMCWLWRALALCYGIRCPLICSVTEWNLVREYLYQYEMTVIQSSTQRQMSVTYFVHDHCEREDVRLLATRSIRQNLWRGPSGGVGSRKWGTRCRVRVVSNHSSVKSRDACMIRVIHKDVYLAGCQYSSETILEQPRTPLRSPCITLHEWR
jgi:hypothetical protein